MDAGREHYVFAARRAMIVQIVEPSYFTTVARAPEADEIDGARFMLVAATCAMFLLGLGAFITYALASFMGVL